MTQDNFSLDTSSFDDVIKKAKSLAETMADLRDEMDRLKTDLMTTWSGKGRNTFEKKYRLLSQQFSDLKDDLYEIAESLLSIEEKYIQADTDIAKTMDGKTSRF